MQVLPSWKTTISGSISLKFRTNEAHGLLLFNRGNSPGKVLYDSSDSRFSLVPFQLLWHLLCMCRELGLDKMRMIYLVEYKACRVEYWESIVRVVHESTLLE